MKPADLASKFLDMLRESTITQSMLTLLLAGTIVDLWLRGMMVPENLWTAFSIVLGFFFGAKTKQMMIRSKE